MDIYALINDIFRAQQEEDMSGPEFHLWVEYEVRIWIDEGMDPTKLRVPEESWAKAISSGLQALQRQQRDRPGSDEPSLPEELTIMDVQIWRVEASEEREILEDVTSRLLTDQDG